MDTPLQGVSSPMEVFAPLLRLVDVPGVVSIIAVLLFIVWVIYTLIAAYHLLRYGHRSAVAIPAIITHVIVSVLLALYAVSGINT
ncbi:MAG: hypothetical protein AAB737_01005 [Patescibacteria group bacterium]